MRGLNTFLLLPSLLRSAFAYTILSDTTLATLPSPHDDFNIHTGALLAPILIPRVPDTPGSDAVLEHFVTFFRTQLPEWKLTWQNSTSVTPTSNNQPVRFRNLIATRDPPWVRDDGEVGRLALVAHFDSLQKPAGFIGATDSAAPCAMIMHVARSLEGALARRWAEVQQAGEHELEEYKGVQVLLLDGEEAFKMWSHTDSLYGARALAQEWETTEFAAWTTYRSPLQAMELFVLLDLLGAENPKMPSYYKTTHWAYQSMGKIEERLRAARLLKSENGRTKGGDAWFYEMDKKDDARWLGGLIEDDHLPFMARGVDILHMIPYPFPKVWHKIEDDGEHLHIPTVEDWSTITTAFAAEWLDLEGYFDTARHQEKGARRDDEKSELND